MLVIVLGTIMVLALFVLWALVLQNFQLRHEAIRNAEHAEANWIDYLALHEAVVDSFQPLTWLLDLLDSPEGAPRGRSSEGSARIKVYLTQVFTTLGTLGLDASDEDMGVYIAEARLVDPPRRLPRYPQTPPYLASPEDIAGVPIDFSGLDLTKAHENIGQRLLEKLGPPAGWNDPQAGLSIEDREKLTDVAEQNRAAASPSDEDLTKLAAAAWRAGTANEQAISQMERALATTPEARTAYEQALVDGGSYEIAYMVDDALRSVTVPSSHFLARNMIAGKTWREMLNLDDPGWDSLRIIAPIEDVKLGQTVTVRNGTEPHWWSFDVVEEVPLSAETIYGRTVLKPQPQWGTGGVVLPAVE